MKGRRWRTKERIFIVMLVFRVVEIQLSVEFETMFEIICKSQR